jgi:secondary thiamine-phosphate synthase enzyme
MDRHIMRDQPIIQQLLATEAYEPLARTDIDANRVAPALRVEGVECHLASGKSIAVCERFVAHTEGPSPSFYDVTDVVGEVVARSAVLGGQVIVSTAHTTCAVIVQENEPLLLADLRARVCRFAAAEESYLHNRFDIRVVNLDGPNERANGHSHCQHALLGASVALPVVDGAVLLGRWQRVLLVELDAPRTRQMSIQVTGVTSAL